MARIQTLCRTATLSLLVCYPTAQRVAAQEKSPSPPFEFEVASIKPVDPDIPHSVGVKVYPGGRLVASSLSLKALITTAFRLSYWQVSGGPAWIDKDEYSVEAKPPESLQSSIKDLRYTLFGIEDERLRRMLQALLIDRFRLKFHREMRAGTVFTLKRNGKQLRMRPTEIPSKDAGSASGLFGSIGYAGGEWGIFTTSMPQLAKFGADFVLHAPVLDQTGIRGSFDYKQAVPDEEPNYTDNSDSFLRFLSEMGLKLERSKGPVEIFVIDQAVKPSLN
jgi:uncharacterized protein (TIGR03435 family)